MRKVDLIGRRFGRLVVVAEQPARRRKYVLWRCRCDCGGEKITTSGNLNRGSCRSCGCLYKTHGATGTPEHVAWIEMLKRCRNKQIKEYHYYGGRGITVCERWLDFENFLADVGLKPSPEHELDRIDNNGNYEPDNVRWTTRTNNVNNRRNTRFVVYRGDRLPLTEAVRAAGSVIHYESAAIRIFRCGWPVELAVETPPDPNHPATRRA